MRKATRRLSLRPETVRLLSEVQLAEAGGAGIGSKNCTMVTCAAACTVQCPTFQCTIGP